MKLSKIAIACRSFIIKKIVSIHTTLALSIIVPVILLLASCTSTRYIEVPVESIRTEYITSTKIDSVFTRDSIDRWIKGDTVYVYKEHIKYQYLNKTDTVVKVDTIPKIVTVEKT